MKERLQAQRCVLAPGGTRRRQAPREAPLPSPRGLVQCLVSAVRKTLLEFTIREAPRLGLYSFMSISSRVRLATHLAWATPSSVARVL